MDINQLIFSLLNYGIEKKLISKHDYYYTLNAILALLDLDEYCEVKVSEKLTLDEILQGFIDYAVEKKLIENTNESKDLFDSKLMGLLTLKPSELISNFDSLYKSSSKEAMDYFYELSKDVNYIRSSRIKKDIHFDYESEYGTINISINISKPEKDPNDIKKLLTAKPIPKATKATVKNFILFFIIFSFSMSLLYHFEMTFSN